MTAPIPMMQLYFRQHPPGFALTGFEDVDRWAMANSTLWAQMTKECGKENLPEDVRIKMLAVALLRLSFGQLGGIYKSDAQQDVRVAMNAVAPSGVILCPACGGYSSRVSLNLAKGTYKQACPCGYDSEASIPQQVQK